MSAVEQESAMDSIRDIESRQDEVLHELELLEQRLATLLDQCTADPPTAKKAA